MGYNNSDCCLRWQRDLKREKKKSLVLFLSLQSGVQELSLTERQQCEISENSKKYPVFLCKFLNFHTRELLAHEAHKVLPPGEGGSSGSL